MNQNKTYKYLSIVLAIIAIVFAILYFTKSSEPVTETFESVSAGVEECRNKIAAWQQANSGTTTISEAGRAELENILAECEDTFEDNENRI